MVSDLGIRDNIPIKITTTNDSGGTNTTTLFRGYTQGATQTIPGGVTSDPYKGNWKDYNVPCVGEWRRLADVLAPRRFTFFDRANDRPFKVTDAIRQLLSIAYPDTMIDVPDRPITLFSVTNQQFIIEPGDSVLPVIVRLASEYLGGWLVFDENAGTYGMWRILEQKLPTYNNLVRFRPDHAGTGIITTVDGAYGTDTVGSQTVLKTFIAHGITSTTERPEGNCVAVFGGAAQESAASQGLNNSAMLVQVVYNVNSYNFLNLGSGDDGYPTPTANPDYLGYYAPIKVYDATLSTPEAVNWVARRVFQYACFGRKVLRFKAPLVLVTDSTDTEQVNPRPLRFYDPVQVWNGTSYDQYIVRDCSYTYTKDHIQMADYELVTTSVIDEFGAVPPVKNDIDQLMKLMKRSVFGSSPWTQFFSSQQKQFGGYSSDWMALPEPTIEPIQDLDNTSGTFGQFLPSIDFDALG